MLTFHFSVKVPPVYVPSTLRVRFEPDGLLAAENVRIVVVNWPAAIPPRLCGTGDPLVVGDVRVAAVSLTFCAVVPPVF